MKKKLYYLIVSCALLCLNGVMAQTRALSGTVTDVNDGTPLPGVSILVQGTTNGTQTDFDGNFTLEAATGDILVFSYLGMKTLTVSVGNSNNINVSLEEDSSQLDEVVVTALGIKREERALGYSVTEIAGGELAQAVQ